MRADPLRLESVFGRSDQMECGNFKEGFSYCIQEKEAPVPISSTTTKQTTAPPSSTTPVPSKTIPMKPSTTAASGNGVETPDPIQPGMVSSCNKFYFVEQGDNCNAVSSKHGITIAQFTTRNPKLGTDSPTPTTPSNGITTPMPIQTGSKCTALWVDYNVCVGVVGQKPTPTQPSNGVTTPSPIQSGITKNCKKLHQVKSTTTCASIQNYYKITMANLFK
ncbi:uncharacterized protein FPRO_02319 [Fusarium proliferatum ET1]|uniref:LysM domain-containing protein n=1 Tax=Fusarium proliferatum (strain ET1) TaxID=1227346 RepID=A0A1L7V9F2_FUSPR|nr:uncharacterized protein FPRO_02319 [Fusarium proliferatum ET1]CZR37421.1 uncharacterized protein FPRO_02319 [Fusarium proliferatum ET1]